MVQAVSEKISEMDAPTSALSAEIYLPATVGTGSSATSYKLTKEQLLGGVYDIRAYGCTTTATAAAAALNTAAIERILVAILAAGGGTIYVPPGTFLLSEGSLLATVCIQLGVTAANITIQGAGEALSVLKLKDSGQSHVINIDGATNIKIRDLTIDGNRANNTTTSFHGVRTGNSGCNGLLIEDVIVQGTRGYGLGLQGGDKKRIRLNRVTIQDTGDDAIDCKNINDNNEDMVFTAISVRRWGLDLTVTEQAGIDCRGPVQLSGIWASEGPADGHYIRIREGETVDSSLGGHYSHLVNFVCEGNSGSSSIGVYCAAHDCQISGGYVRDMLIGVNLQGERVNVSGVTVESCDDEAFQVNVAAEDCCISDCHTLTSTGSGFRIRAPRCSVSMCTSEGDVVNGLSTESGAVGTQVSGFRCVGTAGVMTGIDINSADTTIIGGRVTGCNRGLVTTGARTKCIGLDCSSNVDDGFLLAVGSDDSLVSGCSALSNTDDGITVRSDRALIRDSVITGNTQNGVAIESGGDDTRITGNRFAGNGAPLDDSGAGTIICGDNNGLGGRVARTVDENVVSAATSANIDIPIVSSKTYLFRVRATAEDSNGDRANKIVLVETLRSASAAPTTPTQGAFFVSGDGANLTVNNTISGNNLRVSVTNGMGHDCRLTTVIEEIYRDTTAEDS